MFLPESAHVPPPFDRQLADGVPFSLDAELEPIGPATITALRATPPPDSALVKAGVQRRDVTIAGHGGGEIILSVLAPPASRSMMPGILFLHPGGMVAGNRWSGVEEPLRWIAHHDAVIVTVEYRLAPEHPDPTPVRDCYEALRWISSNAQDLGIDPTKILLAGASAGGGLAAGVALLARDENGPPLVGVMLMCPMLDDRNDTVSAKQFRTTGVWNATDNATGWIALLGARAGTDEVSIYSAPGRADWLGELAPVFIDCGSAEVFRDEDVAFAERIWAAGGDAELHVWAGGFHGFDSVVPDAEISRAARAARTAWVDRIVASA